MESVLILTCAAAVERRAKRPAWREIFIAYKRIAYYLYVNEYLSTY
jgi:hypothetical protein